MGKQLVVISGLERGRVLPLDDTQLLQIGCSQTLEVNCRLRDPQVARVHCEIQVAGDRVTVVDSDTSVGTFLNGERITEKELHPGDVIRIGATEMKYFCDGASSARREAAEAAEETPVPSRSPILGPCLPRAEMLSKLVGRRFAQFHIEVQLGAGYWGRVFRARDTRADHIVALKILRPEFVEGEAAKQHFAAALKAVLPLRHLNLVLHYGAGTAGPFGWIATEYIEGRSLTQAIRRAVTTGLGNWRHACRIAIQLGRALEYAHPHGIVHGWITPQNVLIRDSDKGVKLSDLLLSNALLRRQRTHPTEYAIQQQQDLPYLAPERILEQAEPDPRSDIYGIGATVYALVTGRPPFRADTSERLIKTIQSSAPLNPSTYLPSIPGAFDYVLMKMLEKSADARYQTATELLADLEALGPFPG